MSTAPDDELRRTQQYLAEVIDECVFVEHQRELMERRLSSQVVNQKAIIDGTLGALRHLCRYTHLLEAAVLPGALASLPVSSSSSASRQDLLRARADAEEQLQRLSTSTEREGSGALALPPLAEALRTGVAGRDAPPLSAPPSGADTLRELLHRKTALCAAVAAATSDINAMQLSLAGEGAELAAVRARMEELTRVVVAATTAAKASPTDGPRVPPPAVQAAAEDITSGPSPTSPSAVRFAQARVLAYEKTAQALNNELALLHENYAALSRASAVEMERLRQKTIEAQRRHDDQVAECDAVLGRLSLELEQLIRENVQLKQKMRAVAGTE